MSEAQSQSAPAKPKLRWYQYSLRTLLLFTILACIGMSWVAVKRQEAKKEGEARAAVVNHLGDYVELSEPSGPEWLRSLLGEDSSVITTVYVFNNRFTDSDLERFHDLRHLQQLVLDGPQITDAGLERLRGLGQLRLLQLGNNRMTDAGVEKLKRALPNCKIEWKPPTKDEWQSPAAPDQLR